MKLIPKKDAMIVWKQKGDLFDKFDLKVYYFPRNNTKVPSDILHKIERIYKDYPRSTGNCMLESWKKYSNEDIICLMTDIIHSNSISKNEYVSVLYEFGKIQELKSVRQLYISNIGYGSDALKFYDQDFRFGLELQ